MPPATSLTYAQERATENIVAAAANLRIEINRSVPVGQRAGAVRALNVLEDDLWRAIHMDRTVPDARPAIAKIEAESARTRKLVAAVRDRGTHF